MVCVMKTAMPTSIICSSTNPGEYKKICFAIRDMETEREAEWIAWARSYIGEDLFDTLLDPSMPAATEYFTEIIKSV